MWEGLGLMLRDVRVEKRKQFDDQVFCHSLPDQPLFHFQQLLHSFFGKRTQTHCFRIVGARKWALKPRLVRTGLCSARPKRTEALERWRDLCSPFPWQCVWQPRSHAPSVLDGVAVRVTVRRSDIERSVNGPGPCYGGSDHAMGPRILREFD